MSGQTLTHRFGTVEMPNLNSPSTAPTTNKTAASLRASQERIGAPLTAEQVESYTVTHRGWLIGLTIATIFTMVAGGVALGLSGKDYDLHIGRDRPGNDFASKVVEVTVFDGGVCTGSHVHKSGEVLSATHCFQDNAVCDFDVTVPEYPLIDEDYIVEVMGVNDTDEKWTFNATVLGWSGITDVMVLQLEPLTLARGGVITINRQEYMRFNEESHEMERGQEVWHLSYDYSFLKKLGHRGSVMAPARDITSEFAVGTEQVFVDTNARPGASGSAVVDRSGRIVMAPLTYAWDSDSPFAISGTSSRVSAPLVKRILNPELPPNGPNNKYLVPTLGIVPLSAINGGFLSGFDGQTYLPWTENKGIWFGFLMTQDLYEFVTDCGMYCCGFDPYTVTPPSILGAPLDKTISGSPPLTMTDFPGGCLYCSTLVILEAVEVNHRWHYVGDDVGLETVSGLIIGSGKWAGDTVRVRVRSLDPYNPADPSLNWEGIYLVTLQAIDPFWDNLQTTNILSMAHSLRVDKEDGRPARMYAPKDMPMPRSVVGEIRGSRGASRKRNHRPLRHGEIDSGIVGSGPHGRLELRDMLPPFGPGENNTFTDLPTFLELYQEYINNKYPAKKHAMERSIANRNAYIAAHGLTTHAQQRSLYDHMRKRRRPLFFDRTTVSRTHKTPTVYRKLPAVRKPMTNEIWKRMKWRNSAGQISK